MVDIVLPRAVGSDGVSPVFSIGTVTTGALAVTITGPQAAPVLNFTFPAGSAPPFAISDTTGLQTALDGKQPVDGDLTAIAALTGTNTLYYRSGTSAWSAVTIGANLTFTGGTLSATGGGGGGGGDVYGPASSVVDQFAVYADTTGKLLKAVTPTKGLVGLGNVDNTSDANKPVSTAQQAALDLKAPLASPVLTGNPTAPTPTAGDNDTSIATTAFVTTAVTDAKPIQALGFALSDTTTAITTGNAKLTVRMPYAFTLLSGAAGVRASLSTASSSGIPTVDINENGTTILSTKLTIDATEKTSTTAAVPAVISDTSLADDAEITFDIDVAGTGAIGLVVWLIGRRT